jgi:hypothetical protein
MAAARRERLRDRTADAAAGARDHGGAVMKGHSLGHADGRSCGAVTLRRAAPVAGAGV